MSKKIFRCWESNYILLECKFYLNILWENKEQIWNVYKFNVSHFYSRFIRNSWKWVMEAKVPFEFCVYYSLVRLTSYVFCLVVLVCTRACVHLDSSRNCSIPEDDRQMMMSVCFFIIFLVGLAGVDFASTGGCLAYVGVKHLSYIICRLLDLTFFKCVFYESWRYGKVSSRCLSMGRY